MSHERIAPPLSEPQRPRRGLRATATAAVALALLVTTACNTDDPDEQTADSEPTTEEPTPTEEAPYAEDVENPSTYHDELTTEDEDEATQRAADFVEAAAQADNDSEWWDGVEPFITDSGMANFNSIDPRNIPYTEIDGDPEIYEAQTANLLHVDVPTNGPTMRVLLTRAGSDQWMVESWDYADEAEDD